MLFGQVLIVYSIQAIVREHCWFCWGKKFIFSPNRPDRICGPMGNEGSFSEGKEASALGLPLTI
jgi:hypothetical protein